MSTLLRSLGKVLCVFGCYFTARAIANTFEYVGYIFFAIIGIVIVGTGFLMIRYADNLDQKHRNNVALSVGEGRNTKSFILYLHPFVSEAAISFANPFSQDSKSGEATWISFENLLVRVNNKDTLPLIGIGQIKKTLGPGIIERPDDEWFKEFKNLASNSTFIIIIPGYSDGILAEIEWLEKNNLLWKTIFIMPPHSKSYLIDNINIVEYWDKTKTNLEALNITLPNHDLDGGLFVFKNKKAHRLSFSIKNLLFSTMLELISGVNSTVFDIRPDWKTQKIINKLPGWISIQASVGANMNVKRLTNDDNPFWYFLPMCCPQIFEKYAIILHPFWINWEAKVLMEKGANIDKEQIEKEEFKRISWREFFLMYGRGFDLEIACRNFEELSGLLARDNFPMHIRFPAQGDCEKEELSLLVSCILSLYGDQNVNYYYCILQTLYLKEDIIFKGPLSNIVSLWANQDLRGSSPRAIFPDTKEWCIVTDYNLEFTYVGSSAELIKTITNNKDFEVFEITPRLLNL